MAVVEVSGARVLRSSGPGGFELRVDSLLLEAGAKVALVGPSGCGKSTLLDFLGLILLPTSLARYRFLAANDGEVDLTSMLQAADLDGLGRVRRNHIGYVLQTGGLFASISVGDNIRLPLRLLGLDATAPVTELAEHLGILPHLGKLPAQLSSGERQRVAIARALVHRPTLVLADEPTASLDPRRADDVMALLVELADEIHTTLVVASHDVERVARFGLTALKYELLPESARGLTTARFGN